MKLSEIAFAPFIPTRTSFRNLTGQTYGYLSVVAIYGKDRRSETAWLCRCKYSEWVVVRAYELRTGQTKSCGCLRTARIRHLRRSHGQSQTPEYKAYKRAKHRCENPHNPRRADYGGRGIEFRFNTFQEFIAHIGPRPASDYSLERINNDGHYEEGNVKWATQQEQANNKRSNHRMTMDGVARTITEWSALLHINLTTLKQRLVHGWSVERTLTTPARRR